jgi:hypothetical protein
MSQSPPSLSLSTLAVGSATEAPLSCREDAYNGVIIEEAALPPDARRFAAHLEASMVGQAVASDAHTETNILMIHDIPWYSTHITGERAQGRPGGKGVRSYKAGSWSMRRAFFRFARGLVRGARLTWCVVVLLCQVVWRGLRKRGVWLKLPIEKAALVPEAVKQVRQGRGPEGNNQAQDVDIKDDADAAAAAAAADDDVVVDDDDVGVVVVVRGSCTTTRSRTT